MSSAATVEARELPPSAAAEHHVKFNLQEEEFKSHHENLEIVSLSPNEFSIILGYLKVEHNYRVTFTLHLNNALSSYENIRFLADRSSKHVTFKECKMESNHYYTFTVLFHAYREKHEQETVYFGLGEEHSAAASNGGLKNGNGHHHNGANGHHDNMIVIHFDAKVLGQHQGTPLLRNGITQLHTHSNSSLPGVHDTDKAHFNIN